MLMLCCCWWYSTLFFPPKLTQHSPTTTYHIQFLFISIRIIFDNKHRIDNEQSTQIHGQIFMWCANLFSVTATLCVAQIDERMNGIKLMIFSAFLQWAFVTYFNKRHTHTQSVHTILVQQNSVIGNFHHQCIWIIDVNRRHVYLVHIAHFSSITFESNVYICGKMCCHCIRMLWFIQRYAALL